MRFLGIDVGRATIGLAIADPVLRTARPLHTIKRRNRDRDLAALREVIDAYEVSRLIVGLPLNMDGSEGASARMARAFVELVRPFGLTVELEDERLTTFEAEQHLRAQGFSAREQREKIDAEAAAVILQAWLDRTEDAR